MFQKQNAPPFPIDSRSPALVSCAKNLKASAITSSTCKSTVFRVIGSLPNTSRAEMQGLGVRVRECNKVSPQVKEHKFPSVLERQLVIMDCWISTMRLGNSVWN